MRRTIDIVIPVFNNVEDLGITLASIVSARNAISTRVLIIDDASCDDVRSQIPHAVGSSVEFLYLRNENNLGFAHSVNRGLNASNGDVIVMNSDVEVFSDWVDRLSGVAVSSPSIGTVTPLSNAATILSYPRTLIDNRAALEVPWRDVDRMCRTKAFSPVDIPTGVGFCMYVKRACLDQVGLLDGDNFGAGYGEENDFCQRVRARGWRNVAAPNVFVWHRGSASFGARRELLCAQAQVKLASMHPNYHSSVSSFIKADPLKAVRRLLDMNRIAVAPGKKVLVLGEDAPRNADPATQWIVFERSGSFLRRKWRPGLRRMIEAPNLPILNDASSLSNCLDLLHGCAVEKVLVPSTGRISRPLLRRFVTAAGQCGTHVEGDNK